MKFIITLHVMSYSKKTSDDWKRIIEHSLEKVPDVRKVEVEPEPDTIKGPGDQ